VSLYFRLGYLRWNPVIKCWLLQRGDGQGSAPRGMAGPAQLGGINMVEVGGGGGSDTESSASDLDAELDQTELSALFGPKDKRWGREATKEEMAELSQIVGGITSADGATELDVSESPTDVQMEEYLELLRNVSQGHALTLDAACPNDESVKSYKELHPDVE